MSLPQITMVANAVADPELRVTASGKAVAKLRVACNSRIRQQDGSFVDGDACFLDVTAWERTAEAVAEAVRKGTKVMITGRLQQRSYETATGEKRTVYEVVADEVALVLSAPKKTEPAVMTRGPRPPPSPNRRSNNPPTPDRGAVMTENPGELAEVQENPDGETEDVITDPDAIDTGDLIDPTAEDPTEANPDADDDLSAIEDGEVVDVETP